MRRSATAVLLALALLLTPVPIRTVAAAAYLEGAGGHRVAVRPPSPPSRATAPTSDGLVAADSRGPTVGDPDAPLVTYRVEAEAGLDLHAFVRAVDDILGDARGWTASGDVRLRRVADDPDLRIILATPPLVDERCAGAGLRTNGWFSCFDGTAAVLNLDRWEQGTWRFPGDLREYRSYLVSHEVGHGLGHGHVECPAAGAAAPVMMQQTKGLDGCDVNPWPHPRSG